MNSQIKVGIQGERGSACDAAAAALLSPSLSQYSFSYLIDAERVLSALEDGSIDAAIVAAESPLGVPVAETELALKRHQNVTEAGELRSEVRHCIMILPCETPVEITKVASHPIPLKKHREFLSQHFPGYEAIEIDDTGLAAQLLSTGQLAPDTAVIAMPHAAEVFGLSIRHAELPANDNYLTRFLLLKRNSKDT